MARVRVFSIGPVPRDFVSMIEEVLERFYRETGVEDIYVEVYVYWSSEYKREYLYREALETGVSVVGDYVAMHEAWRGWPRIHIDYEALRGIDREDVEALVIHEAGHTVLHGSPLYYVVTPPEALERVERPLETLYTASTVAKDTEVHRLLVEMGMREAVERYLRVSLEKLPGPLGCRDTLDVLETLKVLSPCVYIDCVLEETGLSRECVEVVERGLEVLREAERACGRDLDCRVEKIVSWITGI